MNTTVFSCYPYQMLPNTLHNYLIAWTDSCGSNRSGLHNVTFAAVRLRVRLRFRLRFWRYVAVALRFENHVKYYLSCQAAVQTAAVCLGHIRRSTPSTYLDCASDFWLCLTEISFRACDRKHQHFKNVYETTAGQHFTNFMVFHNIR